MADLIATEVNADGLQSVYVKSGITRGNCTSVQVFFSGKIALLFAFFQNHRSCSQTR